MDLEYSTDIYKKALSLDKAIFKFGDPKLIEKFSSASNINYPNSKPYSLLEALNQGLQGIQAINNAQNVRHAIYKELKSDIISQIQNGGLIAIGLELPINSKSQPTQISSHLFCGDIDWENSELKFKNLEFSGIRVLKIKEAGVLQIPELKNESNPPKSSKLNSSDLDPDLYIDEKKAAEILGISARTLQGYRLKGGGPEFGKFGKTVRYKIRNLVAWAELYSQKNTTYNENNFK